MNENEAYYMQILKEGLSKKQRLNSRYSLRSFARDLQVHPATLSQVVKGHRPLPLKDAKRVAVKLGLSPKEHTLFLESFFRSKTQLDQIVVSPHDDRFMLDESHFKTIAEWEHYAVLTLFDLPNFQPSISEIATRLGITENRAEVVLTNLHTAGLIKTESDGRISKSHSQVRTTEDISSLALRQSHHETLETGIKKLDETHVDFRDFSAMTVAVDLSKVNEAKTIIREFRQKMASLLRDGDKTEVFQLAIQFYPLTQNSKFKQGEEI